MSDTMLHPDSQLETIDRFKIIGIATKTTNEKGKSAEDIGNLWDVFYSENVHAKIPGKQDEDVYSIYTDYESNHTGSYTCIIGMKVDSLENIPRGLTGREFACGRYQKFLAKGKMPNAIVDVWQEIWRKDKELNRKYTADFEVYGKNSQNGENSEVEIYIAKA